MKRVFWKHGAQLVLTLTVLLALGAGAAASLPVADRGRPDDLGWYREVVDSTGDVGQYASLAFDQTGLPHVTYYDATNGDLKYAVHAFGSWQIGTVDGQYADVGQYTSLALDTSWGQHISYYDVTNANLKYAYSNGGPWAFEVVDEDGDVGQYTSIALTADGRPCISYWDATEWIIKVACKQPDGTWPIEWIDASNQPEHWSSVGVDANGLPVVAYYCRANPEYYEGLKYHYWQAALPYYESVDMSQTESVGQYNSLDMLAGWPHISYFDFSHYGLKYAFKDPGGWTIEAVDTGGINYETSLRINGSGTPGISYYDEARGNLKFAQRIFSGFWQRDVVDGLNGDDVGRYSSYAPSPSDVAYIAYYDATHGDLKVAHSIWVNRVFMPMVTKGY